MRKLLFIPLLLLFYAFVSTGQDLNEHIPSSASIVFEVNFPKTLESISLEEFEESKYGKSLLKDFSRLIKHELTSFNNLGINLNQSQYVFFDFAKGGLIFSYLFPLNSSDILKKYVEAHDLQFSVNKKGEHIAIISDKIVLSWNNKVGSITGYKNINEETLPNYLNSAKNPLSNNREYKKSRHKDAQVSVFMGNFNSFDSFLSNSAQEDLMRQKEFQSLFNALKNYQYASINLISNEQETVLTTELNFTKSAGKPYSKMTKGKLNSDFFNYAKLENSIGYFSMNFNVQNTLEEYPELVKEQLAPFTEKYNYHTELELSLDIFKTVIDEKAIGELIKGDFLLSLSDLKEIDVEYIDYEYDSNWNRVEVVRTKKEMAPDFLAMATVKEGSITDGLTKLLLKYSLVEEKNGFYRLLDENEIPFDLFILFKNNILFVGTSEQQFMQIAQGQNIATTPSPLAKVIKKSQMYAYFAPSRLEPLVFNDGTDNEDARLFRETPDFYFTSYRSKKNQYTSTLTMNTPDNFDNGLAYILNLVFELNK